MGFNSETAKKAGATSTRQGVPNKITGNVREMIASFVESKFEQVMENFDTLKPKEQIKVLQEFLPYVAPKLQAQAFKFFGEFEDLTDQDLNRIINELKNPKPINMRDWK